MGVLWGVVGGSWQLSWAGACAFGGSREGCERMAVGGRAVAPKVRPCPPMRSRALPHAREPHPHPTCPI
eukprot:7371321-Prymnesium_polylepis.1